MRIIRKLPVAAALTLALLGLGACRQDNGGGGESAAPAPGMTFAVITHSDQNDAFFPVLKNGAVAAAKDLGVAVDYTSSPDPRKQAQLVDDAVARRVAGIAVTLPNAPALNSALQKAHSAGIPVITMNSGQYQSAGVGALVHVGQDEKLAGQEAGERLKAAGVKNVLCLIHERFNVGLTERCAGVASTLGGKVTNLEVSPTDVADTLSAKLGAEQSFDGVIALNPGVAIDALQGVRDADSKARLATFDLSKDVIQEIKEGKILFAVDQQPYLQGYLPVQLLYLYKTNLNIVGGGKPVLTGPSFVTRDNAELVAELASEGTR
jgi:simple sugar transport system substrate-binding protein